ncbi:hypothetical protein [Amycolatopsis pigmentata]|uniref:VRR-NUC domain-containing protein n=1 Tax=Amycolatopsis pigmentata TaxID=450801 RepID=A0ABW5G2X6_9PSEU
MTALRLTEAQFQQRVLETAAIHGWRYAHFRPARTVHGWRTPVQGYPGVPDLLLARHGVILLTELKTDTGRPTTEQLAWLEQLGNHGRLWRPRDWDQVHAELSRPKEH